MSTAQETPNKTTFRQLTEAMNTGDRDLMSKAIDAAYAPDALIHTAMPVQATGSQAIKEVFGTLYRAFPDLHIAVDDLIEEGDKMVARNTVTGTHRGEYMGVPPTGKLIKYNEIFVLRFVNGRIAETGGIVDVLSQMKQLGVIPLRPDPRDQKRNTSMAKFLFVYRSDKDTFDTMAPEELQRFHQKWQTWMAEGLKKGWMLDASTALKTEGRVVHAKKVVTEGPFVEGTDVVRGYVNLQADTLDAAAELAKGCPILLHGGMVEIRQFWEGVPGIK